MGEVTKDWQYGLCGCCGDMDVCCLGCWCPCILYGNTQATLKGTDTDSSTDAAMYALVCVLLGWQSCIFGIPQRMKVRHTTGLPEKTCADVCTHICCHGCALCQESRQLKYEKAMKQKQQQQYGAYQAPHQQNMLESGMKQ